MLEYLKKKSYFVSLHVETYNYTRKAQSSYYYFRACYKIVISFKDTIIVGIYK